MSRTDVRDFKFDAYGTMSQQAHTVFARHSIVIEPLPLDTILRDIT